jgi:hypothetical protein
VSNKPDTLSEKWTAVGVDDVFCGQMIPVKEKMKLPGGFISH